MPLNNGLKLLSSRSRTSVRGRNPCQSHTQDSNTIEEVESGDQLDRRQGVKTGGKSKEYLGKNSYILGKNRETRARY